MLKNYLNSNRFPVTFFFGGGEGGRYGTLPFKYLDHFPGIEELKVLRKFRY